MIHVHSKRFDPVLSVCSKQHYDNICMIRRRRNLFDCNAGRLDWQCMGRLGQLHCLSFACFRERVGSPGRNSQNTCGLIMLVFVLMFHQEAIKIALKSKTHVKILLPSNTQAWITTWACRLLPDFGTPPGSQLTGASRTSSDVVKRN